MKLNLNKVAKTLANYQKEQERRERKAIEKAEQNRRQKFVDSWLKATPEEQAVILYKIMQTAESAHSTAARANSHFIRY
jgi:acyl-CoA reductase-like NAD-dependent aldehyde dehydrogenase